MPSSALGWRVATTITELGSCVEGLIFAQTVNGSPYSGMGVTNKLHEGIVLEPPTRVMSWTFQMEGS